jgi:hypothetical protein
LQAFAGALAHQGRKEKVGSTNRIFVLKKKKKKEKKKEDQKQK